MIKALTQWFGSSSTERAKLTDTELQPSQDYRMAQSFSGESVNPANGDGASETTSISRASSYQKLNGDASAQAKDAEEGTTEQSSLSNASFNLINSIVGAGVIGIPYAYKQAGFGLGICLTIVVALFTDYSMVLLVEGGKLANTNTYQGLVNTAFGRTGFLVLTAMQFLYPFIAMISYNVIVGDTVTAVILRIGGESLKDTALGSRQFIIVVFVAVVMLPLSLFRDVTKISKASLVSLVLVAFLVITLLVKAVLLKGEIPVSPEAWQFAKPGFPQAIGILSFAYMCHHNSFLIYTSLENPTQQRWNLVTHASIATSMVVTLLIGILGYVTFTDYVQGDVLLNYCRKDDFINVARFAYAMTIVLTWPLECFVTREVIENSVFATKEPQLGRHILITVIIAILTCGISMATDCLGIVMELNGSLAAIPLAFIFPPVCVLRLQQEPLLSSKSVPKLITAFFGIATALTSLIMTTINIADGYTCSHGKEPEYCPDANILATNGSLVNSTLLNFTSITGTPLTTSPFT